MFLMSAKVAAARFRRAKDDKLENPVRCLAKMMSTNWLPNQVSPELL